MTYPITWKPAHGDNFTVGRSGETPGWLVHHRMVGYLTGTDRHFARAGVQVSTHFGIGRRVSGGKPEISQYVLLDDTAFGNGNNVDSSGKEVKSEWNRLNFPSRPNRHTISIEHEDGATLHRGVVDDDIIAASIWLDSILLSGDPATVRAAGIRFRSDALVRSLADIPRDETHIIDHHFIAGPLKPYCWRRWLDDAGFPQPLYLKELSEEDMRSFTYTDQAVSGWYTVSGDDHLYLRLRNNTLHPIGDGIRKRAFGPVTLTDGGITGPSDPRKVGYLINGEAAFMLNTDGVFLADPMDIKHTVALTVDGVKRDEVAV